MTDMVEQPGTNGEGGEPQVNPLEVFVSNDLPNERKSIMSAQPNLARLQQELGGTLIQLMIDGFTMVGQQMAGLQDHLEAVETLVWEHEQKLDQASSHLTPEDADLLGKVVVAYRALASELLAGRVPPLTDAGVREALTQTVALAEKAQELIASIVDEDEGDEDEGDDSAEAAS